MKGLKCLLLLLSLAAALMTGCASSEPEGAASVAVQEFYRHLNDGNYDRAMSLYNAEARGVLQDPNSASDSAFADWAKLETKDGEIDRVEVLQQEELSAESASVQFRVVYSDGSTAERTAPVTLEQGKWKLGLVG